ncbi:MAG TPA: VCBS repeat-containing protein, partial [bacterium]|nr:VCBS repeat-containing protein [bacterium]
YSFISGQKSARVDLEFRTAPDTRGFTPEFVVAIINCKSTPEIVVATYDRLYAFNIAESTPAMELFWESGRNYGELVVTNIDDDPFPEVVMQAYEIREHLSVIDNDGKQFQLLWDKFFEQNYPEDNKEYLPCIHSVQDFDGDKRADILLSLFNEAGDGKWHVLLADAITGEFKTDIPDMKALSVVRSPSSNNPWTVLTRARSRTDFRGIEIFHPQIQTISISPNGQFLSQKDTRHIPEDTGSSGLAGMSSQKGPSGMPFVSPDGSGSKFFIIEDQVLKRIEISDLAPYFTKTDLFGLPATGTYTFRGLHDIGRDGQWEASLTFPEDSRLHVFNVKDHRELYSFPAGGARRIVLCARLHPTDPQLTSFIVDGMNQLQAWIDLKARPRKLWQVSVQPRTGVNGPPTVTVFDFDGDGNKEILTGLPGNRLAVLNDLGQVVKEWQLDAPVIDWAVGNFNGDSCYDILAVVSPRILDQTTVLLDLKKEDANPVWTRAGFGAYTGWPVVWDVNRDGIDDMIVRYFYMRHMIDGRNGLDVFPITWRQGYHCPTIVLPDGPDREPLMVWSGAAYTHRVERLDGSEVWNHWAQSMYRPGCVGDFNGDGRIETVCQTTGTLYDLGTQFDNLKFEPLDESYSGYLFTWDVQTGQETGRFDLGETVLEGSVSGDVDGDGRDEILVGTVQGSLMILGIGENGLGIEWRRDFGASVGRPTIADIDLDGNPELLVGIETGNIVVLECRK